MVKQVVIFSSSRIKYVTKIPGELETTQNPAAIREGK